MIDITGRHDNCFAQLLNGCKVCVVKGCDGCSFYKPKDCSDWVRIDSGGRVLLVAPEEFLDPSKELIASLKEV